MSVQGSSNGQQDINSDPAELALSTAVDVLLFGISNEEETAKQPPARHERVAQKALRRLLLRHAQLKIISTFTRSQLRGGKDKAQSAIVAADKSEEDPNLIAYRLAVTDLFVEKALAYLEDQASLYSRAGQWSFAGALVIIASGIAAAAIQIFDPGRADAGTWLALTSRFTQAFTFYGMIVLGAVGLSRFSRAMLDQAERLLERRHAVRQGRLFVHLSDGRISLEQMEKAFNWNVSQANAFGGLSTDAKAPWGAALEAVARTVPETVKQIAQAKFSPASESKENESK